MNCIETVDYLIRKKGSTKKELASFIGVHQGSLNQLLRTGSLKTIQKLSEYFGMSMEEFSNFELPSKEESNNYMDIIKSQQETIQSLSKVIENMSKK